MTKNSSIIVTARPRRMRIMRSSFMFVVMVVVIAGAVSVCAKATTSPEKQLQHDVITSTLSSILNQDPREYLMHNDNGETAQTTTTSLSRGNKHPDDDDNNGATNNDNSTSVAPTPTPIPNNGTTVAPTPTLAPHNETTPVPSSITPNNHTTPSPSLPTTLPPAVSIAPTTPSPTTPSSNTTTPAPTLAPNHNVTTASPVSTIAPSPAPIQPPSPAPVPPPQKFSLLRFIEKTIALCILFILSLLAFGAIMQNRYRIYFFLRGVYYTILRMRCTHWILVKLRIRNDGGGVDSSLNAALFENDAMMMDQGLLMRENE